ncbi:MAG: extracellular solute-binding protein, partial [Pseudomonadota bacterium]
LRPILNPRDWEGRDFAQSTLDVPVGTGPYTVGTFEPGRFVEFVRNPDYWARDLPFNAGRHNVDVIRYDYFADGGVIFEAFKAGEISTYREGNPAKWEAEYTFPAIGRGEIVKSVFPHSRPAGLQGFVFNTRRTLFQDWRVRDALLHAFNFEFVNQTLNGGVYPRRSSYFANSPLAMSPGPAQGEVRALLEPFAADLLPGALEGYSLPSSNGEARNRTNLRHAAQQLAAAGWQVKDGVLRNGAGEPFRFAVMLRGSAMEDRTNLWADGLRRLGIEVTVENADDSQYTSRRAEYDFDVIVHSWSASLSPGNEQRLYWGANGVTEPGTRNYMGMNSPAAEAMIDAMLTADSQEGFVAAARALDRVLMSGRYVVPFWFADESLMAHKAELKYPERLPLYGDWIGFLPDVWWVE